jgi:hypothetical protein
LGSGSGGKVSNSTTTQSPNVMRHFSGEDSLKITDYPKIMKRLTIFITLIFCFSFKSNSQVNLLQFDSLFNQNLKDTTDIELQYVSIDYKDIIKKLRTTDFYSGSIYFAGYGFPFVNIIPATDKSRLKKLLKKCNKGSSITLSKCILKREEVISQPFSRAFILK